jgi:DNA-directed RNA polymerase delta subunit
MAEEINRANSEAERLKRDLGRARKEMEDLVSGAKNEQSELQITQLESRILQQDAEMVNLREQLVQLKETLETQKSLTQKQIVQLQNDLRLEVRFVDPLLMSLTLIAERWAC